MLSVKYNDQELGEFLEVLKGFSPLQGADWRPQYREIETNRGADFEYTSYKTKKIEMPFTIKGDVSGKYDEIQKKLNAEEPKKLVFENLPDRMFYAIPEGNFDFEEKNDFLGEGVITWLIPDGLAHATTLKSYTAYRNNGILEMEIDNQGTEAVPIDFEITNNHENGYIGIVSDQGIIQIGRVDEKDEEQYEKSQLLLDHNFATDKTSGWELNKATTVKVVSEHAQVGTGGIRDGYLCATDYGAGNNWHGPSWTHKVPADANGHVGAKNCTFGWHHYYTTSTINNLGVVQYLMTDKNKKNVAAVTYFKNAAGQNYGHIHMYINGKVYKEIDMECSYWNPITGQQAGRSSISKYGDRFEFSIAGTTYAFNAPEMKDVEVAEISVYFGQWGTNEPIGANLVYSMRFMSHSVAAWRDVPNRFKKGSVVRVDGNEGKIYTDGVVNMLDEVRGSKYILAPPGKTKIQFGYSDFSDPPPTIKAYIREAYL